MWKKFVLFFCPVVFGFLIDLLKGPKEEWPQPFLQPPLDPVSRSEPPGARRRRRWRTPSVSARAMRCIMFLPWLERTPTSRTRRARKHSSLFIEVLDEREDPVTGDGEPLGAILNHPKPE